MAIKALKQNVSIREIQKMIHQWKNRGINDPTVTKLLDLHLGMPAYMNESGIYPLCNFYYIRIALKFSYTTALITAVTDCHTFGLIWDEGHTKIIAFYSPLWYHKSDKETKKCAAGFCAGFCFFNSNILYNINNIYSPKDSHKGLSCEDIVQKQPNIPSENPAGTPHGDEAPKSFFICQRVLSQAQRHSRREAGSTGADYRPYRCRLPLHPTARTGCAGRSGERIPDSSLRCPVQFCQNTAQRTHHLAAKPYQDPPWGEPDTASHTKNWAKHC